MKKNNTNEFKLSSVLAGVAGEYFVAAELSARGYVASITLRNTKGIDILCSNEEATRNISIQVKTNSGSNRSWLLNKKGENYHAPNLFYVFVNLNSGLSPVDYFIVPSEIVSSYIKETHATWLKTPSKTGKMHVDTAMRKFDDLQELYKDRWDLLKV